MPKESGPAAVLSLSFYAGSNAAETRALTQGARRCCMFGQEEFEYRILDPGYCNDVIVVLSRHTGTRHLPSTARARSVGKVA